MSAAADERAHYRPNRRAPERTTDDMIAMGQAEYLPPADRVRIW